MKIPQKLLWLPFAAAFDLCHAILAVYFVFAILGGKGIKRFLRPKNLVFVAAYALTMAVENVIYDDLLCRSFIALSPVFILLLIIYAVVVFKKSWDKAFLVSMASNLIIFASLDVCGEMNTYLFGSDITVLFESASADQFIAIISSPIMVFYIMFIILRMSRKIDFGDKSSVFLWALVSVVLTISDVVVMEQFVGFGVVYHRNTLDKYLRFALIYTVLTGVVVYWLLSDLVKKNRAVGELNLLRQTEEYNRQYISQLQNEFDTVRMLRHDYKNSLLGVAALLKKGETESALGQLSQYLGEMSKTEILINTDNAVLNAVVNAKLSSAKSLGIECSCLVAKDISGISDADLCRLLSNMLDNAITACKSDGSEHRRIELRIQNDEDCAMITVKNTVPESVLGKNPGLRSTKETPGEHGFGVRIIREIAEKYGGRSDFYEEDGMFCCGVYLLKSEVI